MKKELILFLFCAMFAACSGVNKPHDPPEYRGTKNKNNLIVLHSDGTCFAVIDQNAQGCVYRVDGKRIQLQLRNTVLFPDWYGTIDGESLVFEQDIFTKTTRF